MSSDGSAEMGRLAADLQAASREVMPRARLALRKALTDIQAGAQNRAPVDTGALKGSITVEVQGNRDFARGEVGPTVHYGGFVETGTSRQRAQPYLRPATDAVIPGYHEALGQVGADILGGG
ncbi:HK97 gp10 family phage protein [Brachybacterium sp. NBEC-018]|uniref:HK97-gp10 family putative phage morphogenesis protein n=1 Tax=Brachybacterium sp. NBEC-018 TaxID=2996004 RepID=UPI0021751638|nr:HK97-gp10 family putative phage morphogenesis protein [Brachybacterium sp. NBEC-018]UVY83796.1 HK97 gp10 family phage protein [Brachybacterium sp. NBEC-018]